MDITTAVLTIIGLAVFESITSIDNAIINAEVLATMQARARRWFLTWGMPIAVFGVRGLLPWLIVWVMSPGLDPWQALTATFYRRPGRAEGHPGQRARPAHRRRGVLHLPVLQLAVSRSPRSSGCPVRTFSPGRELGSTPSSRWP